MTTAPAAEPIGRPGLGPLIERLKAAGFPASTSEAVDATRLLLILARKEPEVALDPERLRARMRPIFCRNREQQERFDEVFDEWYGSEPARVIEAAPKPVVSVEPQTKAMPRWRVWLLAGLLLTEMIFVVIWAPRMGEVVVAPAPQPAKPIVTPKPPETPSVVPQPPAPVQTAAAVHGYFPRLRYNRELRWPWAVGAALLPLLPLVLFSIPAMVIARMKARRRTDPMFLEREELERTARRIVPPLHPDIVNKLARHLRGRPDGDARLTRRPILDVRATLESTLRNRGIPSPQYRHTHAPPSYLLLVDISSQDDARGRHFYQWADRLRRARLDVEIALVRLGSGGQPQFRPTSHGELPRDDRGWMSLARLPEPPFGQRLLFVSTGGPLIDDEGRWRSEAIAARLYRWRQRALFTPIEPRDWDQREDRIERKEHTADPGFLVLPLEESALAAWTDLLTTGQLTDIVLSEPQRFPGMLRKGRGTPVLDADKAPARERVEKLIGQLRVYLGELGFQWLAALAIPPIVRWELTVLIGRDVIDRLPAPIDPKRVDATLVRHYRRLQLLPWLQAERMPDWLRFRLLRELPRPAQDRLREVVRSLLGRMRPGAGDDGIALNFDRPPDPAGRGPVTSHGKGADALYLGYMSGLSLNQLEMVAPDEWASWLPEVRAPRERGIRGFLKSSASYARSVWARCAFLRGMPVAGVRLLPLGFAAVLAILAAAFLFLAATKERDWWPEALERRLFGEEAHAIAFHHPKPVRIAKFSPDGTTIVTASDDGVARVWDVKTAKPVSPPLRHDGPIADVTFDGKTIMTASGSVSRLWHLDGRAFLRVSEPAPVRRVARYQGRFLIAGQSPHVFHSTIPDGVFHGDDVNDVAFTNDGSFVTASDDGTARVWRADGKSYVTLAHGARVLRAMFNASGDVVLTVTADRKVWLWDPSEAYAVARFAHTANILDAALSPDGRKVVTASADGAARVWESLGLNPPVVLKHAAPVRSVSFSSDSQRIVTASDDGSARVWDATTGRPIGPALRHRSGVTGAAFNSDGTRIVTASLDGTVRIWEAIQDDPATPALGHTDTVTAVSFDTQGKRALTASYDKSARIWDAESGAPVTPPFMHGNAVLSALFSLDGRYVLTASADEAVRMWNAQTGVQVSEVPRVSELDDVSLSPDGREILTLSPKGVQLWNSQTGALLARLGNGNDGRLSPDGRYVAIGAKPPQIWEVAARAPVTAIPDAANVFDVRFSQDGRFVVTTRSNGSTRVWNARTGEPVSAWLYEPGLDIATVDPQSRYLLTVGDANQTARIWDMRTGRLLHVLKHDGEIFDVQFSADGRRVATASEDNTARVWSATTGEMIAPPMRHHGEIFRVAFSQNGKRLITGGAVATAAVSSLPAEYVAKLTQIWRLPPDPRPDSSNADVLRGRAERAYATLPTAVRSVLVALALIAFVLVPLFVALRRRRQLERII
jgi:WD40 repeat protein